MEVALKEYICELEKEIYIYSSSCKRTVESILRDLQYIYEENKGYYEQDFE